MYNFNYQRPATLDEAVQALSQADDGILLAGGHTLLPTMKQRLSQSSDLIDLTGVPGLDGINRDGDSLVVGALARHGQVAASAVVREAIPALADLAGSIGDPQVRNRGTLGGSVANADPAADYPAALVALNATVNTNKRSIGADDFFTDLFETALEAGEIIVSVSFQIPDRAAYMKFPSPASRYAMVGVFVAKSNAGVRVAVTGAGASVFRVAAMEQALGENFSADAIADISVPADDLNEDLHASPEYRAHLVTVMAKRAVVAAGA